MSLARVIAAAGVAAALGLPAAAAAATKVSVVELDDRGTAQTVGLGDLTGDGRAEVVAGGWVEGRRERGTVWVLGADRRPRTTATRGRVEDLAFGDVTGDGRTDVVVLADGIQVLSGDGRGGLTAAGRTEFEAGGSLALADVTGDGLLDVVADEGERRGTVLVGDGRGGVMRGAGTFPLEACIRGPGDVLTGDLDGSGTIDVATVNFCNATLSVGLGAGDGSFAPGPATRGTTYAAALGDLTGDGVLDLAGSAGSQGRGSLLLQRGVGGGRFERTRRYSDRRGFFDVATADADRDGRLDVVATQGFDSGSRFDDRSVVVLAGDGAGGLRSQTEVRVPLFKNGYDLAVGDLDGDGAPDAAVVPGFGEGDAEVGLVRTLPVDDPLAAVALRAGDVQEGGVVRARVTLRSTSRVVLELVPRRGGKPLVLRSRRLPAGTHTVAGRLRARRGATRPTAGVRTVRVTARSGRLRASRRLPLVIVER